MLLRCDKNKRWSSTFVIYVDTFCKVIVISRPWRSLIFFFLDLLNKY